MRLYARGRNSVKIFVAITTVAALVFFASDYLLNKKNEVVVAKVNGEKILKSDIERKLISVFDAQDQNLNLPEVETLPKEVLELLAKEVYLDKALIKEAKKSGILKNKRVQHRIDDSKTKIIRQSYIDTVLSSEVTEQKLSEKYLEISNDIVGKKEYQLIQIAFKTEDGAKKLLKELGSNNASKKLYELAKKYSSNGDSVEQDSAAYIFEDSLPQEISGVVVNLKKDEVSQPISTKRGWYVVKVLDSRNAVAVTFEAAKDTIRNQLIQDKISEINNRILKDPQVKILIKLKDPEPVKNSAAEEESLPKEENLKSVEKDDVEIDETELSEDKAKAVEPVQTEVSQEKPNETTQLKPSDSKQKKELKKSHGKAEKKRSKSKQRS